MAHFAELTSDGVVVAVLVIANNEMLVDGAEQEIRGVDLLESLFGHRRWKQTSYNGRIRKRYAGIGYTYDERLDAFIPPRPGEGWTLDEATAMWVETPTSE
jgi:hypothetical protein